MIHYNDFYEVHEVSDAQFEVLKGLGCHLHDGMFPINYCVVNKSNGNIEHYSCNLPSAIHIADNLQDAMIEVTKDHLKDESIN